MEFTLAPSARDAGYRLECFGRVGSTNALALQRAGEGDAGRLWLVAESQESGRGRRGRPWASPPGNLYATVLMRVGEPAHAATLGFVAGLSLAEALQRVAPDARALVAVDGAGSRTTHFAVKWPNDVLADGAKISGILLESTFARDGMGVAVGIGVNVTAAPEGLPYPATSLSRLDVACDAARLFAALSERWAENAAVWDEGKGRDAIRRRWLEQAAGLGAEASVRLDGAVVRGTFETIDEDCRFVLRAPDGTLRRITAGDVHFGVVASANAG